MNKKILLNIILSLRGHSYGRSNLDVWNVDCFVAALLAMTLMMFGGCRLSTMNFNQETSSTQSSNKSEQQSQTLAAVNNSFNIRILESTGSSECLDNVWSYLDESSPMSSSWQMLHGNGLRCGVGQFDDWTTLKEQLEKCGTKVQDNLQISLSNFSSFALLTDQIRPERTIFYYDLAGKGHMRDFYQCALEFNLMTTGKMAENRIRLVFSTKVTRQMSNIEQQFNLQEAVRKAAFEQELENFNIIVDVGPKEFALLGPSSKNMAGSLVGSQLFSRWEKGQRKTYYLLISPMELKNAVH